MTTKDDADGFSAEERQAMKDRAAEVRAAKRRGGTATGLADVLAAIAAMPEAEREIAERIHAIVTEQAPELTPKTWYGMPGWARGGTVVCFFQSATKFSSRYCTLGFSDAAALDDGAMWPAAYALVALTPADEERIAALVRRAAEVPSP